MKSYLTTSAAAVLIGISLTLSPAHAGHVYGGIIDTNGTPGLQSGDALAFVNNTTGVAITGESLGVQLMTLSSIGSQSGLYFTTGITWTALSDGLNWTGAAYRAANAFAATSGSLLQLQIVSVTGPSGAKFSFWDDAVSMTDPATTYTIGSGITSGSGIWNLTDLTLTVGDGMTPNPTGINNPPVDPYGHIHGRSFTVDTQGEYTVSYILHDASGNQVDSAPFTVSYSAVPEPGTIALLGGAGVVLLLLRRRRSSANV